MKQVVNVLKLQIPAGGANPAPPIGPVLGQAGVNIMEFCKAFNAASEKREKGEIVPVELTVYSDRSYTFVLKTPPASYLLMKTAGVKKGSSEPNKVKVGEITADQLREIAKVKMADLNAHTEEAAVAIIEGTARSLGLRIV